MNYSLQQFEADILKVQQRPFDRYILPAFLVFYAIKSKKPMGRKARRILFIAGMFAAYRSYADYKTVAARLAQIAHNQSPVDSSSPEEEPRQGIAGDRRGKFLRFPSPSHKGD